MGESQCKSFERDHIVEAWDDLLTYFSGSGRRRGCTRHETGVSAYNFLIRISLYLIYKTLILKETDLMYIKYYMELLAVLFSQKILGARKLREINCIMIFFMYNILKKKNMCVCVPKFKAIFFVTNIINTLRIEFIFQAVVPFATMTLCLHMILVRNHLVILNFSKAFDTLHHYLLPKFKDWHCSLIN